MNKEARYNEYFMDGAYSAARMSYAKKLQVGTVATRNNRIILDGFNGMPPGMDNTCEDIEYMPVNNRDALEKWPNETGGKRWRYITKDDVMHSEENLVLYAAKTGISLDGTTMYCTHAPCINCARMIYGSGVKKLYYAQLYRSIAGIKFLTAHKVLVEQYEFTGKN